MNLQRTPSVLVSYSAWLRGWCALTAVVAFLAVVVGTLVTTFHVGMADPLWPTAPWHLLVNERLPSFGWYVEHTHRIAAYAIASCIFVQSMALWWFSPNFRRRLVAQAALVTLGVGIGVWMKFIREGGDRSVRALVNPGLMVLAAGALVLVAATYVEISSRSAGRWARAVVSVAALAVIGQAILGGLRVYLNERLGQELRVVHGVFAQVVFACSCLLALMATRRWNSLVDLATEPLLRNLSAATLALLVVLVVFGGLLRHLYLPLAQFLHPLLAFAAVALVMWMAVQPGPLRGKAWALLALVAVQAALGIEAWIRTADPATRYSSVELGDAALRSLHVLLGFGIVASAALLAARAWKPKLT
jgi:heme A synthase